MNRGVPQFLLTRSVASTACRGAARMSALGDLSDDQQRSVFGHLCNTLEPGIAVNFGSASRGLRASTQAQQQQLRADYDVVTALCHKTGMRCCKELREAREVCWADKGLCEADLTTLSSLGSVLPALKALTLSESAAAPDSVQRLMDGLRAGALPALWLVAICDMNMDDSSASALAGALDRGALPRLTDLNLSNNNIGDAGLVALAPVLRRRPALEALGLTANPISDEGLAALVAPPQPAAGLSLPAGGLNKLYLLNLRDTAITDTGCASLASALNSGGLPAVNRLDLAGIPASFAARAAVRDALATRASEVELPIHLLNLTCS